MSDIIIDLSRDSTFDELGLKTFKGIIIACLEKLSPQERFAYVCNSLAQIKIILKDV